jgi:hypothetical protein
MTGICVDNAEIELGALLSELLSVWLLWLLINVDFK